MWWMGGHLGAAVSALVDGQLDEGSAERAWRHVAGCDTCRHQVQREGWVKRQLAQMSGSAPGEPPSELLGSLYGLRPPAHGPAVHGAWAEVERLEERARRRRRTGLAAVGVGSVSAAVLGLSALGAAPLDIGGTPTHPPTASLSRSTPPSSPAPVSTTGLPGGPSVTARR